MLNIYRASAGSGKTYRLTQDYIRLLFSSFSNEKGHRRVLAVTFTNKATDEMKSRILKELFTLSNGGGEEKFRAELISNLSLDENKINEWSKKNLIRILHDYSAFSISTIDTFFQQVLRSFTREIGVSGGYNLELDTDETLENAVDTLFQDLSKDENKQLLQWLTTYSEEKVEQAENWNIRTNILELGKEIFKENYQNKAEETNKKLHDKSFLNNYIGKIKKEKTDFEKKVAVEAENALEILKKYGLNPDDFSRSLMHKTLENLSHKSFEVSATFLKFADDAANCYANNKPQSLKNTIETAYANGLGSALKNIVKMLSEDIIRYNTADLILKHLNTLGVLSDLAMYIKHISSEQNTMLISDTNMLLSKIIEDSDAPFVYERTGINVDHFMIDEFQDTSVLQWKNFKPLIKNSLASNQKNMLVGDVKQSIYRWRNSDWKLLQEKVREDFQPEQIKNEVLETNWRSDKNIVEFNNDFFKNASLMLQAKFNESIEPLLSVYPDLEKFNRKISGAYQDVSQQVKKDAGEGHVKIEFIPNEGKKEDWMHLSLERVPKMVEDLVDKGYKLSDIVFLVRKNKDAVSLIDYLYQYKNSPEARKDISYNVIGNEGILLSASLSVEFIIGLLKTLENPNNDIQRTIMNYGYLRGKLKKTDDEAVKMSLVSNPEGFEGVSHYFTEEENQVLKQIQYTSLYELTETIIDSFKLTQWFDDSVFLQAFQDAVYRFVNSRNADLNSFLTWWDKSGYKQNISTPENQQALRVMTIHKSKGLDFKVVIAPFCDWSLDSERLRSLIWMQSNEEPFNELPLIPLNFTSKLGNSIFAEQYYEELLHQYVDSLNMAYVAFTRARNELICFVPAHKEKSEKTKKEKSELKLINSISEIMMKYSELKNDEIKSNDENSVFYELGEMTQAVYAETTEKSAVETLTEYPIVKSSNRLFVKDVGKDAWKTENTITENRLNFGVIMHEILQNIKTRADEEKLIQEMIFSGRINDDEAITVRESLNNFWKMPQTSEWFSGKGKILNEATIIIPGGALYRPDRVMIEDEKVTVIDYKFGDEKRSSHQKQVRQYADILQKMGYKNVETYLVYVTLSEVEKV